MNKAKEAEVNGVKEAEAMSVNFFFLWKSFSFFRNRLMRVINEILIRTFVIMKVFF